MSTEDPMTDDPVVIVGAARTPIGAMLGVFADLPATTLGATAISAAISRAKLKPQDINEVLMGCVLPAGLGQAPARQAALLAGIPASVGATTLNKMCGSGMKAVMLAKDMLCADPTAIFVAGGMENMSQAPYLIPKARVGYRLGHAQILDHMMLDGLEDAYEKGKPMGAFAEITAEQYGISRQAQDDFARTSLRRAKMATEKGWYATDVEITPVIFKSKKGEDIRIEKDEIPERAQEEKIPNLKPAFKENGTVTAANSSSISDGAAALVLMRLSEAKKRGLTPVAKIVGQASFAAAPVEFTTAPIGAIRRLFEKIDWNVEKVDLFEINEAFAVVALVAMQELKIPLEKLNIHGGAAALGHPIGASGARIICTLLGDLKTQNKKYGVAALCIGGGEATAIAIERL